MHIEWTEIPLTRVAEKQPGIGLADMAYALRYARSHRASGDMAYHVLDVMHGFLDASETGTHYKVPSTCTRPAPLPLGLLHGTLDR